MIDKLKEQLESVLLGEESLLRSADLHNVNIEQLEAEINKLLNRRIIFGSGDNIADLVMGAYMIGRKQQFFASMDHLFGNEQLKSAYQQICIKLGINAKTIN
jgi:hypothetical protein